ncbi:MAG: hypothetical protein R2789_10135 [Microthrixaceae bacterium]
MAEERYRHRWCRCRTPTVRLDDVVARGAALVDPAEEMAHTARSVGIYLGES